MSAKEEYCESCGKQAEELHHIVFKSQCMALKDCKLNHSYLCINHHRNQKLGVHFNKGFDRKLKLRLQNKLEAIFDKKEFTREEIGQALEINESATDSLYKMIRQNKGAFYREDIIRACMGGKIIEEETINE